MTTNKKTRSGLSDHISYNALLTIQRCNYYIPSSALRYYKYKYEKQDYQDMNNTKIYNKVLLKKMQRTVMSRRVLNTQKR